MDKERDASLRHRPKNELKYSIIVYHKTPLNARGFYNFSNNIREFVRRNSTVFHKEAPMNPTARHPLPWLLLALAGFGAGLLNGLLGAAGGILLVAILPRLTPPARLYPPAVRLGLYHERRDVLATALAVMLPVSGVSGVFYWLNGIRTSPSLLLLLILPAALDGLLGAKLLGKLPDRVLKKLFAALVVASGVRMIL